MIVLLMGVTGVGKTTIGGLLATALGGQYVEGDDFHSPANLAKMRLGIPLGDEDRLPWLHALGNTLQAAGRNGEAVVLGCSALKEAYRQVIRTYCPACRIVWLHGPPSLIAARINSRQGHIMRASLLSSQLAILEPPVNAIAVNIDLPPEQIVKQILDQWPREMLLQLDSLERGSDGA